MSNDEWQWMFQGRQENMQRLIDKWELAKNNQPQFDVIVAPTGFGKTRLIQEFYLWLSANEDPPQENAPQGYWPDSFLNDFTSNEVNPHYPPEFQHARAIIPWLWWGVSVTEDAVFYPPISKAEPFLQSHIDSIVAKRELDQIPKEKLKKMGKILASLAADWATFGIASPLHSLWETLQGDAKDNLKKHARAISSPDQALNQFVSDRHDVIFEMMRLILDSSITDAPTIPMIFILDDSQFLYSSKYNQTIPILGFVRRLWLVAKEYRWPLFIIATHWDDEWERQQALPDRETPINLAQLLHELGEPLQPNIIHRLEKLSHTNLKSIVKKALPGLTKEQNSEIVAIADGHPRMLRFYIERILNNSSFFVDGDTAQQLTVNGQRNVSKLSTKEHDLIRYKIEGLEEKTRQVLGLSSIQGERFLSAIIEEIVKKFNSEFTEDLIQDCLNKCERPECLIERLNNRFKFILGQFNFKPINNIAKQVFRDEHSEEFEIVNQYITDILKEWINEGRLNQPSSNTVQELSSNERRVALMMVKERLAPKALGISPGSLFEKGTAHNG